MKLTGTCCYSKLLWVMSSGKLLEQAINNIKIGTPNFAHEGMAGYIETRYEIEVKDLSVLANIFNSYYTLSDTRRLNLYGLAKGLGDCK